MYRKPRPTGSNYHVRRFFSIRPTGDRSLDIQNHIAYDLYLDDFPLSPAFLLKNLLQDASR